jgi:ADP-ribose pyrophosphatase
VTEDISDQPEQWTVESSRSSFSGAVISIRSDTLSSPVDGSRFVRDVVEHPGAVAVVAVDEANRVLLVRQYRHPVGYRLVELPAGLRDVQDEPLEQTAARELYEEGHVRASDWRVLADVFSSPGMTDEAVRIFLARGITSVPDSERYEGVHEEADMTLSWSPLADVVSAVLSGSVHNALLCVGILAAWAAQNGTGFDPLRRPHGS